MGFLDWMFRSRKTGRITLAQLPNWQFAVWLLASAVMWLAPRLGTRRPGRLRLGVGDFAGVLPERSTESGRA